MKLYHGTSFTSLNLITDSKKILPQKFRGADQSNDRLKSKNKTEYTGFTFLATTMDKAKYYSNYVSHMREHGSIYEVVIEVEVSEEKLLPDNDDLQQAKTWQESANENQQVKIMGEVPKDWITNVHIYDTYNGQKIFEHAFENWKEEFDKFRINQQDPERNWYKIITNSDHFREEFNNFDIYTQTEAYEQKEISVKEALSLDGDFKKVAINRIKEETRKNKEKIHFKREFTFKPPFTKISKEEIQFNKWLSEKENETLWVNHPKINEIIEETVINVNLGELYPKKENQVFLHQKPSLKEYVNQVNVTEHSQFPVEISIPFDKDTLPECKEVDKDLLIASNVKIPWVDNVTVVAYKPEKILYPESFENEKEYMEFANEYLHFGIEKSFSKYEENSRQFRVAINEREKSYEETKEKVAEYIEKNDTNAVFETIKTIENKKLKRELKIVLTDLKLENKISNINSKEKSIQTESDIAL